MATEVLVGRRASLISANHVRYLGARATRCRRIGQLGSFFESGRLAEERYAQSDGGKPPGDSTAPYRYDRLIVVDSPRSQNFVNR